MKKRLLFLIFTLCVAMTNVAQNTGVSVQGIARDASKAALANKNLNFVFDVQTPNGTSKYLETQNLTTDAFGVFSHIIGTGTPQGTSFNEVDFSTKHLKLVISLDGTVISDQPFQYIPYAYHANNGAPTGSVMPYLGPTAPKGWLLCNGDPIPNPTTSGAALVALIGNNTPDLKGMFLRGTGVSSENQKSGPELRTTQNEDFKSHNHEGKTGNHDNKNAQIKSVSRADIDKFLGSILIPQPTIVIEEVPLADHTHTIPPSGGAETRPVNYGVNYIVKL
ncbi:phage tail protein [Aquimarina sp. 2201CG1-2-11]|uniref:phage tail protein n=1 Tax=Aquimarina discodermiae TaxID=3231043 RepID=UPI003462620E